MGDEKLYRMLRVDWMNMGGKEIKDEVKNLFSDCKKPDELC